MALGPPKCVMHMYVSWSQNASSVTRAHGAPKSQWGSFGYYKALEAMWGPRSRANEARSRQALILRLFDVLIQKMTFISGANKNKNTVKGGNFEHFSASTLNYFFTYCIRAMDQTPIWGLVQRQYIFMLIKNWSPQLFSYCKKWGAFNVTP